MYPDLKDLKQILVSENYVSEESSTTAEKNSRDSKSYIEYLIRDEILTKELLGQALAEYYNLPFANLGSHPPQKEELSAIPEIAARDNRAVFVKANESVAAIATDDPSKVDLTKLQEFFPGKKINLAYALPEYIDIALSLYDKPLETRFSKIIAEGDHVAPEIVDEIIGDALSYNVSDIHFEPGSRDVLIRFRYDGYLREAGRIPKEYYENILNKIKVDSGMRIDEHLNAQDGSLQRTINNTAVDFRVSLVPTVEGEKVVFRVLGSYIQSYTLADIGLSDDHREKLELYAKRPFGMILTTGPTGSGKTTTLYSILKLLNKPDVNVTTIEDPVEYKIERANQIQVREATGLTFAKGLRSIVRQDPDIILVGEIRDEETAEISVNAALTGHLLLSTFHANDAATSIPRLVDLGIEPFLLASTLEVVVAQRLVRRICSHCKHSVKPEAGLVGLDNTTKAALMPYIEKLESTYEGKGCSVCSDTGYNGRTALFEFIDVSPSMQELILKSPSTQEITKLALSEGFETMFDDGMKKVKQGLTTIQEVVRVVEPPNIKTVQSDGKL